MSDSLSETPTPAPRSAPSGWRAPRRRSTRRTATSGYPPARTARWHGKIFRPHGKIINLLKNILSPSRVHPNPHVQLELQLALLHFPAWKKSFLWLNRFSIPTILWAWHSNECLTTTWWPGSWRAPSWQCWQRGSAWRWACPTRSSSSPPGSWFACTCWPEHRQFRHFRAFITGRY